MFFYFQSLHIMSQDHLMMKPLGVPFFLSQPSQPQSSTSHWRLRLRGRCPRVLRFCSLDIQIKELQLWASEGIKVRQHSFFTHSIVQGHHAEHRGFTHTWLFVVISLQGSKINNNNLYPYSFINSVVSIFIIFTKYILDYIWKGNYLMAWTNNHCMVSRRGRVKNWKDNKTILMSILCKCYWQRTPVPFLNSILGVSYFPFTSFRIENGIRHIFSNSHVWVDNSDHYHAIKHLWWVW